MRYTVTWEELVYDAFGEFEVANPQHSFIVEADSFDAGESLAGAEALRRIKANRTDWSHGMFIPEIRTITDQNGMVREATPGHRLGFRIHPVEG